MGETDEPGNNNRISGANDCYVERVALAEVQYVNATSSWLMVRVFQVVTIIRCARYIRHFFVVRSPALPTAGNNGVDGEKVFYKLQIHLFTQQANIVHPLCAKCPAPFWDMNHSFTLSTVSETAWQMFQLNLILKNPHSGLGC